MYYVFDALEIIMGPYDSYEEAKRDMEFFCDECYLEDQFPHPYVDFIVDEDEELAYPKRQKIIKRKERYDSN
jgi:hypothetical protein